MKKKIYEKPTFKVILLQHKTMLLAGSGDPTPGVPWWDGEGGAPRYHGKNDEDEEDEEEDW